MQISVHIAVRLSCQNHNYDTTPRPPNREKNIYKGRKKYKGMKKADRKTPNQVTILPEIAKSSHQSGQKAGNMKKIHLTGSYLMLPPIPSYLNIFHPT